MRGCTSILKKSVKRIIVVTIFYELVRAVKSVFHSNIEMFHCVKRTFYVYLTYVGVYVRTGLVCVLYLYI